MFQAPPKGKRRRKATLSDLAVQALSQPIITLSHSKRHSHPCLPRMQLLHGTAITLQLLLQAHIALGVLGADDRGVQDVARQRGRFSPRQKQGVSSKAPFDIQSSIAARFRNCCSQSSNCTRSSAE